MMIFIASDHAGFEMKNSLYEYLLHHNWDIEDTGPYTLDVEDDYPNYAFGVATQVLGSDNEDPRGILLCGSGQGMAMAANRVSGIRAALAWESDVAKLSREHEDTNILVLPSRFIDNHTAADITDVWLKTAFSQAPRHIRRLQEIETIYG